MVLEQDPSVLIDPPEEVGAAEADVEVAVYAGTLLAAARYQFVAGSPRHSPTGTDLNPWLYIEARM